MKNTTPTGDCSTGNIQVVIIDDHPVFRAGVRSIIDRSPGVRVVDEAGSAQSGIEAVRRICPDVVLLDLSLPDRNGLEIVHELQDACRTTAIVVLSMKSRPETARRAFALGVSGYVTKDSAASDLHEAIQTVYEGKQYLSRDLDNELTQTVPEADSAEGGYELLTTREQEVFRLLAEGKSSKQIAGRLEITAKTADSHKASIYRKLGIADPMELVRLAARMNVIEPDRW